MQNIPDEALVYKICRGDSEAFSQLYERYKTELYSFCLRLLRSREPAEDAVHDTMVKLYTECRTIREPEKVRSWLFMVARNEVFMQLRHQRNGEPAGDEPIFDDDTPLSTLLRKEKSGALLYIIDHLSPQYKEAILLREFEQLSYAEIAAITATTVSAVKARLFKARKAMAEKLGQYFEERKQS